MTAVEAKALAAGELRRVASDIELLIFPARFRFARLDQFSAVERAGVFRALDTGRGVFAAGPKGCGKTHLSAAIVREYAAWRGLAHLAECWQTRGENGWDGEPTSEEVERYVGTSLSAARAALVGVVFRNAVELMDDIRAVFDGDGRRKTDVVEVYAAAELLVVDDLGMDKSSEFVRETFDSIINHRWADSRLTVFTSNLDFEEIDRHYGDRGRMTSRIAGMCDVVQLTGADRRVA